MSEIQINFKNNNNAKRYQAESPEKTTMPSKTVPDMTLSLKELLKRHANGQNITILQPDYQADQEYNQLLASLPAMPEFDRLDLARKIKMDAETTINELEASEAAKAAEKQIIDAAKKKEYDDWVKNKIAGEEPLVS